MAIKITPKKTTPVVTTSINSSRRTASVSGITTNSKIQTATSIDGLTGVDLDGVQDGYTLVYDSSSGNWEAAPAAEVAANIQNIDGGTF